MLYDLLIWLDVCSFDCELGSGDSVEGGPEQVPYLSYELSSEANVDLSGIHDLSIVRRCVIMVPIYVHKYIKISLYIYTYIYVYIYIYTHTHTHTYIYTANAGLSGREV